MTRYRKANAEVAHIASSAVRASTLSATVGNMRTVAMTTAASEATKVAVAGHDHGRTNPLDQHAHDPRNGSPYFVRQRVAKASLDDRTDFDYLILVAIGHAIGKALSRLRKTGRKPQ